MKNVNIMNIISLSGLALGVGMLVDNAIVVIEKLLRIVVAVDVVGFSVLRKVARGFVFCSGYGGWDGGGARRCTGQGLA